MNKPSKRRRAVGLEFLSEETQVLFQLLHRYHLTSEWQALTPSIVRELTLMYRGLGLDPDTFDDLDVARLVLNGMLELEDSGHIGCYTTAEPGVYFFRQARGQVRTSFPPCKDDLVNRLVERFGTQYFSFDPKTFLVIGCILRASGIDWESRKQLQRSCEALVRMKLIEVFPYHDVVMARLGPKLLNLHQLRKQHRKV